MNGNIIIRNIKLSILGDVELKEPYLSIYNELISTFSDLEAYILKREHERIYYIKNEEVYIDNNYLDNHIFLNTGKAWNIFIEKYYLSRETTQKITSWYLENFYNMIGTTHNSSLLSRRSIKLCRELKANGIVI